MSTTLRSPHSAIDAGLVPAYPLPEGDLRLTLKQLRWLAIVAPIIVVALLEYVRLATIGAASFESRILLDGLVAAALVIMSVLMVRSIGRMQARLERHNQELLALHGAGLDVTAELALEAVLKKAVDRARDLVGAKYGALSVVGDDGAIQAFITAGISSDVRAAIGPPPVGHGLLGVTMREGEHLRLSNIQKDPRSYGFPPNHPMMRSLLAVPIRCKGPFVGNLYLSEKTDGSQFTVSDEETLVRFAVQAAIAIDNAHLHKQVGDLAVAQERLRIAHEMHDGLAQVLGYVNTKVQAATEYIRREKLEEGLVQLRELASAAREAYGDVREAIVDLRTLPTPDRTFEDVLREYVARWQEQTDIDTAVTVDPNLQVPSGIELQLVRIIQESLTNVRKHARASNARIEVRRRNGEVTVTVTDDGVGFAPVARSRSAFPQFGLSTMRERAEAVGGTFHIESAPGSGTTVQVAIPLPEI